MMSASGRYVISFNGEVYNHLDLREQLSIGGSNQITWRGRSDTETLIACIETWGLSKTLRKSVGMYAFALWDRRMSKHFILCVTAWVKNHSTTVTNRVFFFLVLN